MKKKSTSQSAFFNLRILVGLFIGLAGVSLALLATAKPSGRGAPAGTNAPAGPFKYKVTAKSSIDPLVPAAFDCSKVKRLGIDRQENLRAGAIMIHCGLAKGGGAPPHFGPLSTKVIQNAMAPLAYGGVDVDLITGTETFPNVTQSETFTTANPDDPTQVFVAYNDSRGRNFTPLNISGGSFSSDGGNTFTRLTKANGQSPFDNTVGDPVILFHEPSATWVTVWLDLACGGQGLGGYKSTTPADPNSWTHFCAFNEGSADRESGWADNNPSSPFFGRLYVSWNDFNVGNANIFVINSTDAGTTWSSPVMVSTQATFVRDVQITGDLAGSGAIYVAGMDEGGGGFPHQDTNLIFKSTDGGSTWSNTYTGTPFPGPGVTAVGYFAQIFNANGGYWRHEGWGQPAAINNFVHLVYDQHGTGSDPADVYYIRSTDGGVTFGTPVKLNTDTTDRPNWQPNLSVSPTGTLLATWYDARVSGDSDCVYGSPTSPCYQMFSSKSNDNGASWLPDDTLSDVVSPLPSQPDPGIQGTYAGDYDYGSAIASKHVTSWTDGRNAISGQSQQDAFTDRDLVGFSVATADPACGSLVIGTAPTDFQIILSDPADPSTVQASDFTVNGTPADTANLSNGNQTIDFIFNSSPVTPGENTMHIDAGAIHQASNNDPILEFNCTFRFGQQQLTVSDTNPPVGGTFTPPAPGSYTYDVNWNIAVDPSSVTTSDLQVSGNAGASVTAVTVTNGGMTTEFTLQIAFGGSLTAHIAAGAITDTFGNPNADFSGNYTVSGCPPSQYTITDGTDTIVPGDTDIGSHCDDCDTAVTIPFPFQLYDQTYTTVQASSNGRLDFVVPNEPGGYVTACLPAPPNIGPYDFTVFPVWEDMRTDFGLSGCASFPGGNCGIFTSVSGSAPNRIFNIEWRAVYFANNASTANFEARLYENGGPNNDLRFDVIVGTVQPGGDHNYVSGVQGNSAAGFFTQDFCDSNPPAAASHTYEIPPCASPTPTPTPGTPTPTPTPGTPTPTPTPTTPTPTPTPRATPRPRPTPHPRPTP
jgi:hypothetical protein